MEHTAKGGSFKIHSAVTVIRKHLCVFKAVFFAYFSRIIFWLTMLSLSPCRISSWDSRQYRAVIFWLDCIMFTSLFSAKPIESCGKFPQPQYTLNRLKSPDDFLRNLTVLHFHSEKVSDTVVNRVLRLNFKAGIDNIVHVPDPIFFALHYFVF